MELQISHLPAFRHAAVQDHPAFSCVFSQKNVISLVELDKNGSIVAYRLATALCRQTAWIIPYGAGLRPE